MGRRISIWVLFGIVVACCWVALASFAGPTYNPGRSLIAAITAPASLLGRRMALSVVSFIFLNGGIYGAFGLALEALRWPLHFMKQAG